MAINADGTIKVYHYTPLCKYESMFTDRDITLLDRVSNEFVRSKVRGLIPFESFIPRGWLGYGDVPSISFDVPSEAHECVTRALLEPEPSEWLKDRYKTGLMTRLIRDIFVNVRDSEECSLLEIQLLPEDRAVVADISPIESSGWNFKNLSTQQKIRLIQESRQKYWKSRVPIETYYLEGIQHEIPEVSIPEIVPPERLSLVWIKTKKQILESFGMSI